MQYPHERVDPELIGEELPLSTATSSEFQEEHYSDSQVANSSPILALSVSMVFLCIGMIIASTDPEGLAYVAGGIFLLLGTIGVLSYYSHVYEAKNQETYNFLLDLLSTATLRGIIADFTRRKRPEHVSRSRKDLEKTPQKDKGQSL